MDAHTPAAPGFPSWDAAMYWTQIRSRQVTAMKVVR